MKTAIGNSFVQVFDATALKQIADWAERGKQACKDESQRLFKEHHAMATVYEAIEDQMVFEALISAIDTVLLNHPDKTY